MVCSSIGVNALKGSTQHNDTQHYHLGWIGDEGAVEIARLIAHNHSLTYIDLEGDISYD